LSFTCFLDPRSDYNADLLNLLFINLARIKKGYFPSEIASAFISIHLKLSHSYDVVSMIATARGSVVQFHANDQITGIDKIIGTARYTLC